MSLSVPVWAVTVMLLGHWVADFVLQPHWMSMRKSKEWWVLTLHALRITAGSSFVAAIVFDGQTGHLTHQNAPTSKLYQLYLFAIINGGAHFVIDAVTSRMTSKLWAKERVHEFFVVIGFDQFLHLAIGTVTLAWLVTT